MATFTVDMEILQIRKTDISGLKYIGHGAAATVFKGHTDRFGIIAVKSYQSQMTEADKREINLLLMHSKHPNIIQVFALLQDDARQNHIGYVMEYMPLGTLSDVIHRPQKHPYDERQIYSWIQQIGRGLQHLHLADISHRDVKPKNILLGKTIDDVKLGDFGEARDVSLDSMTAGVGTTVYMAPEVMNKNDYGGVKADVYSLAITIWEMIHRTKPFCHLESLTTLDLMTKIQTGERPKIEGEFPLKTLLLSGWDADPSKRPKIKEFTDFGRVQAEKLENNLQSKNWILILGGKNEDDTCEEDIYLLDFKNEEWELMSFKMPLKIHGHGAAVVLGDIYVFGGSDDTNVYRSLFKLNRERTWERKSEMVEARFAPASVELNGTIWVMGGSNGRDVSRTVERYDPSTNEWTPMPAMKEPRYSFTAAVIGSRIYVCGHWFDTEYFDLQTETWVRFAELPEPRIGLATVAFDHHLLLLGGCLNSGCYNNVWSVNTDICDEWEEKPPMLHGRTDFRAVRIGNELLAIGGCEEYHKAGTSTEIFDGKKWREGPSLPLGRSFYAIVQLSAEEAENVRTDLAFSQKIF